MNAVCVLLIIHRPKKSHKDTTIFAHTQVIIINFYKKKNFLFYYTRTFLFYCLNSCIYAIFLLLLHPKLGCCAHDRGYLVLTAGRLDM